MYQAWLLMGGLIEHIGLQNGFRSDATVTVQINITPDGRMGLPADVRKRLGLTGGGAVYLDETDDGIVLRTAGQAVTRAQVLVEQFTGNNPDTSVGRCFPCSAT